MNHELRSSAMEAGPLIELSLRESVGGSLRRSAAMEMVSVVEGLNMPSPETGQSSARKQAKTQKQSLIDPGKIRGTKDDATQSSARTAG